KASIQCLTNAMAPSGVSFVAAGGRVGAETGFADGEAVGSIGSGPLVHELSSSNAAMASVNNRMESPDSTNHSNLTERAWICQPRSAPVVDAERVTRRGRRT